MSSEKEKCKRCGAVIPAESTEKLCPACLMSIALGPAANGKTIRMTSTESISLYGPTEFPCQFGDYRLLGLLGRGGMGSVYEALQLTTGRRVALKMLGEQLDSPEMRKRFLREGRLAASVNHPNSLYIFGSEEIEGLPVITMEIAGGGTLKDRLKEKGPLPVNDAVDAILDVISGLESAFAGGVLHRDIKPSNCFVSPDGSVKVGDFGLSVSTLSRTDTFVTAHGRIMGTPAYASPEQLRGDTLDGRADIYSVGATLYTLLTNRAPFEGDNAVQVVANAVNKKPKPLTELHKDIPPALEKVVARCLAKEPQGRYPDYKTLRNALLPFSSREPEPASMFVRASAGWIDYLIAFLPPYVALMFLVGADKLIVRPLVERTLFSMKYYFILLGFGFLYFTVFEGLFGAGLGKYLKGLRVVRTNGRPPGILRALIRILIPIACVEGVRMPLTMAFISTAEWSGFQTAMFVIACVVCGWIPILFTFIAKHQNGFATIWELASGTRVIVKSRGTSRPSIQIPAKPASSSEITDSIGPYRVIKEIVADKWIAATDPVLRRTVWLLRRSSPELPPARRNLARPGRLRWLQMIEKDNTAFDTFEAPDGIPFINLIENDKRIPWSDLRHWLHDLASELWEATGDNTLPDELSLDHVWITTQGRAVLLDEPWPDVKIPTESIPVKDLPGQQRFLNTVAACVESTSVPLHARSILHNLADGKFEKLSFFTGTLRGFLDKPAQVSRGIRAASIFMLPFYLWIAVFVGYYHDKNIPAETMWTSLGEMLLTSAMLVLTATALIQLLTIPFSTTIGQFIFKLAVINTKGRRADKPALLKRWAITWLPLLILMIFTTVMLKSNITAALLCGFIFLVLWLTTAIYAVINPHRGLHDHLAGTWIVRN